MKAVLIIKVFVFYLLLISAEAGASGCGQDEFNCYLNEESTTSEAECIHLNRLCDGIRHCSNGQDEGDFCQQQRHQAANTSCKYCKFLPNNESKCFCDNGFACRNSTCQDINECELANTCDHRFNCVNTKGGYKCTCNPGYKLNSELICKYDINNSTSEPLLLFTSENNLLALKLDSTVSFKKSFNGQLQSFNYENNTVCYIYKANNDINCELIDICAHAWTINLNLNSSLVVIDFKYIDFNWYLLTQEHFYICSREGDSCKESAFLFGNASRILYDSVNRWLFVIDQGYKLTWFRVDDAFAKMREFFFETKLIAIDQINQFIYFVDSFDNGLYRVDYSVESSGQEFVFSLPMEYSIQAIGVFEDNVYFYEAKSLAFYAFNRHSKSTAVVGPSLTSASVENFQVFYALKQEHSRLKRQAVTKCVTNEYFLCKNGKCVHNSLLCNGYDNCEDNSDEDRGTVCKNFACPEPNQYDCGMNYCIPNSKLCDLSEDCPNGSDEILCQNAQCTLNEFKCSYVNQCVNMELVCDGKKHCYDNSDETIGCIYKLNITRAEVHLCEFKCEKEGLCLELTQVCDGQKDCVDGQDERNCTFNENSKCPEHTIQCTDNHACILEKYRCDGEWQCDDGSDELFCDIKCNRNEFFCKVDGSCINNKWLCDGEWDCKDGSDETNADCDAVKNSSVSCDADSEYVCKNGRQCFFKHWKCDGKADCYDKSDEEECDPSTRACATEAEFKCSNGTCISYDSLCDEENHCPNGEDEFNCSTACGDLNKCSYNCLNFPNQTIKCTCPEGMKLGLDQITCIPIDPCTIWGICSQECENLGAGRHACSCFDRYQLSNDKRSCISKSTNTPTILYSNRLELRKFDLDEHLSTVVTKGLKNTIVLDYLYEEETIFWSDITDDVIYKSKFNGIVTMPKAQVVVDQGLSTVEGIAVDWLNYKIYWVESKFDHIEVSNLDGTQRMSVISGGMHNPRAIAVDPINGLIFWSDWDNAYPRIERASMSGADRMVVFNISAVYGGGWPNGITLDTLFKRVYYIDAKSDSIHAVSYDGAFHKEIVRNSMSESHGYSLAVYGDHVYWSDWKSGSIYKANKWDGSDADKILYANIQPFGLVVYHDSKQLRPANYTNPCSQAPCSHLCLLNGHGGYECKCPYFMKLDNDKQTCTEIETMMFISTEYDIRAYDYDHVLLNNKWSVNAIPPLTRVDIENLTSVDYDPVEKKLYYLDGTSGYIARILTNGSGHEKVIQSGLTNSVSLSIDWISRNIYFTTFDSYKSRIQLSKMNGLYRTTVLQSPFVSKPVSLVVYPTLGYMFWLDVANEYSKLVRSNMDGSNPVTLVDSQNDSNFTKPQSLSINFDNSRLYWIVPSNNSNLLYSCNMDGSNVEKFKIELNVTIKTASVHNNELFFAVNKKLYSINLISKTVATVYEHSANIANILFYSKKSSKYTLKNSTNACSTNTTNNCDQVCTPIAVDSSSNLTASNLHHYKCACAFGFKLGENSNSCASINSFLMYSAETEIHGVSLNTELNDEFGNGKDVLPPLARIEQGADSIAYLAKLNRVYWVDSKAGAIFSVKRDSTDRKALVDVSNLQVENIAVDWIAENIYWTSQKNKIIEVARLNGSFRYVLVHENMDSPRAIAVDPRIGYLFWTDNGDVSSRIERSTLDGDERHVIYTTLTTATLVDLAIDYNRNKILWCDQLNGLIMQSNYDGNEVKVIAGAAFKVNQPHSIDLKNDVIYWIELARAGVSNGVVKSLRLESNESTAIIVAESNKVLKSLRIYDTSSQIGTNLCGRNNGYCQHLCLFNGRKPICRCSHANLTLSGKCEPYDEFIFFSRVTSIDSLHTDMSLNERPNSPVQLIKNSAHAKNVVALAVDYENKRLFYSDIYYKAIKQLNFDGSNVVTLVLDEGNVEGLAYDVLFKQLYWTSYANSSIKRVNVDTKNNSYTDATKNGNLLKAEIVVQLEVKDHPRAIVIDSCNQFIYWTNWNDQNPSIQQATLNGSFVRSVITKDIRTPNGLAIDHKMQSLYYADAKTDRVYKCQLGSFDCQLLTNDSRFIKHTFALAIHDDWLYFTDWSLKAILRLNKFTGKEISVITNVYEKQPMSVVIVSNDTNNCYLNPCLNFKCNENYQRIITTGGQCACICMKGFIYDQKLNACTPLKTCPRSQFRCFNGLQCIKQEQVCDGTVDCRDASDEANCTLKCEPTEAYFTCKNDSTKCLPVEYKCNQKLDCSDGSDEEGCEVKCNTGQFQCFSNDRCIDIHDRCDGVPDCEDESDERNCESIRVVNCTTAEFKCEQTNRCIPLEYLCDGINDCYDNSDESMIVGCRHRLCKSNEMKCDNGMCIDVALKCDGHKDCIDGSDEARCFKADCFASTKFQCRNYQCIDKSKVCDGVVDCLDSSDEVNPECISRRMNEQTCSTRCLNGACITFAQLCNQIDDCGDNSDELFCNYEYKTTPCEQNQCDKMIANSTCEQVSQYSYKCACQPGYRLNAENKCVDVNECEQLLCGQFCANTPGSYICSCDTGYQLDSDKHSCVVRNGESKPYVLYGDSYFIKRFEFNGAERVLTKELRNVVALDFDYYEQKIYFSDITTSYGVNICRIGFDGKNKQVLHSINVQNPDGLAVDWIGRNLYWCDKEKNTIEVSKLNGSYPKIVLSSGLDDPRAIVLYPRKRLLFYSDWGEDAHIGRASMDGTEHRVILNRTNVKFGMKWPNGLTIDYITLRLYWADAKLDYIAHSTIQGNDIRLLLAENVHHIFAISVFEDYIYWSDWETKVISRTNKHHAMIITNLTSVHHRPTAIQVVHPLKQLNYANENTACADNNGNCTDLCLLTNDNRNNFICACADNYELASDQKTCVQKCSKSQFNCYKSHKCINYWLKCDGYNDCDFGEDEYNCTTVVASKCPKRGMFSCGLSGACVESKNVCDGVNNCAFGVDEQNCESYNCLPGYFKCNKTNKCILRNSVCDGKNDCFYGEDEQNCESIKCRSNQYKCNSGKCINLYFRCDGHMDCTDGDDEVNCHNTTCSEGNFRCNSTGKCIPVMWLCDGEIDCLNVDHNNSTMIAILSTAKIEDEDRSLCEKQICEKSYFKCRNNQCIPGRWRCDDHKDCRDGSDEEDCAPRACTEAEIQCKSDLKCIHYQLRCNGEMNCLDGSDELDCPSSTQSCNSTNYFACKSSGFCIPSSWRCDGNFDCEDESDERNCDIVPIPCKVFEHRCANSQNQCIPEQFVCDGVVDCDDELGSDESECSSVTCVDNYFKCDKNKCIPDYLMCDNKTDCADGSDEKFCDCGPLFQCKTNPRKCLQWTARCDSIVDCEDRSDEEDCNVRLFDATCESSGEKFKCEQQCVNHQDNSHFCTCDQGFKLDSDGITCVDINECSVNYGHCSQMTNCLNLNGSAFCFCYNSPILPRITNAEEKQSYASTKQYLSDPKTSICKQTFFSTYTLLCDTLGLRYSNNLIDATSEFTFIADNSKVKEADGHVEALDTYYNLDHPNGDNHLKLFILYNSLNYDTRERLSKIVRFDFDIKSDILNSTLIMRNKVDIQIKVIDQPKDLAIEWISKRVYWTEFRLGNIMCASFDGSNEGIVITEDNNYHPLSIAINSLIGRMYWSSVGAQARIRSARLDGTNKMTLVESRLEYPINLQLDLYNHRLYWLDYKLRKIDSISTLNKQPKQLQLDRHTVYRFDEHTQPKRFDLFDDFFYVVSKNSTSKQKTNRILIIHKFNKSILRDDILGPRNGREFRLESIEFSSALSHVHIMNPLRQPAETFIYVNDMCKIDKCAVDEVCVYVDDLVRSLCVKLMSNQSRSEFEKFCSPHCVDESQQCCSNRGKCAFNETNYTHRCSCDTSYSGSKCEVETCDDWCFNNGTCSMQSSERSCKCMIGYKGKRCELSRCKNYCMNGATCSIDDQTGRPICACNGGFGGKKCDKALECSNERCLNTGECVKSSNDDLPSCNCKHGTYGDKCQYCKACENNATCQVLIDKNTQQPITEICKCKSNRYNGSKCETDLCGNYCKNDGKCGETLIDSFMTMTCKCSNSRYIGKQCEVDLCESLSVKDCVGSNCILSYNQTLKECQCFCSNLCDSVYCNRNGKCEKSKCSCYEGFYGERCEFKVKGKSMELPDEEQLDEDEDAREDSPTKTTKTSNSKILLMILIAIGVFIGLLFALLSLAFRKRFLFKRQFQSRQFSNTEFDEFNLSMENIEIRNPLYRTLHDQDEEHDVNNKETQEEEKFLVSPDSSNNIGFENNAATYSEESNNCDSKPRSSLNSDRHESVTSTESAFQTSATNKPIYTKKNSSRKNSKSNAPHNINI